ncbi:unnamed protein product [Closterium sp. NIES-53]
MAQACVPSMSMSTNHVMIPRQHIASCPVRSPQHQLLFPLSSLRVLRAGGAAQLPRHASVSAKQQGGRRGKRATVCALTAEVGETTISRDDVVREDDPTNNVPDTIFAKIGARLHTRADHPLSIIRSEIHQYFDSAYDNSFLKFDHLAPIVATSSNFDDLLIPTDHVSRSYNDTYYIDGSTVLRTHTSAHQAQLLRDGHTHFLVTGDVYRRDAIDATHYPVFHQMEGFRVFSPTELAAAGGDPTEFVAAQLKQALEGLARHLFGDVEMRWVDTYFPFTNPSFELEIFFQGQWLEVLGCGVTEQQILDNCGLAGSKAWAFGLGLERLAMVLFDIPDIRLFWSNDDRFLTQRLAMVLFDIPDIRLFCGWLAMVLFDIPDIRLFWSNDHRFLTQARHKGRDRENCTKCCLREKGQGKLLAMVLFDIPDIRLFWSNDDCFLTQDGKLGIKFKPFSKVHPPSHALPCCASCTCTHACTNTLPSLSSPPTHTHSPTYSSPHFCRAFIFGAEFNTTGIF